MNIAELKTKIIMNELPSILIFTGPETGIMNIYINQIQQKLKYKVHKVDSVEDVFKLSSGNSIFKINKLFIVTDDLVFLKTEEAWNNLSKVLNTNKVIFKFHNYDSRLGFWKHFEKETVIFERMSNNVLSNHLSREFNISVENCSLLAKNCDNNYIRCQLELNKVINFAKAHNITNDSAFKMCYNDVLCLEEDIDIFDFVNSVITRNYKEMIVLYSRLKRKNEPVVKMISLLYNTFKNVLIAQTISNAKNIQQTSGISYYVYVKAKEQSGHYSIVELENILYILMRLEQGIKTGQIEDDIAIDYLFSNL